MHRRLLRWFIMTGTVAASLGLLEGGYDRWLVAYLALWSAFGLTALLAIDDDLVRERFHPPDPGADRSSLRAVRLVALGHLVIGALDAGRWHAAPVPDALRIAGLGGAVVFSALIVIAMRRNHFFSAVVRVQHDRGHRVVDSGPYARVRHPGYAGMIVAVPCSALALGSWFGVALALVYSALILRRVMFEDAFLQSNLRGYREYTARVRYRLLPGAW